MTRKLYDENTYQKDFTAVITAVRKDRDRVLVALDQTAFFPESGGQPGDSGTLNGVRVSETVIHDGEIWHVCPANAVFAVGDDVEGKLDLELRFSRMQGHTGEHILSGLAHEYYGCENTGFHMDRNDVMTVDFDKFLEPDALARLETEANARIWENRAVTAFYPSDEELATMTYRAKLEDLDETRIVLIDGVDACACCAPHVKGTAEVGLLKILTAMRHRGGVRLTVVCGKAALLDYRIKQDAALHIADVLASKHGETAEAVDALLEKNKSLQYEMNGRTTAIFTWLRDELPKTEGSRTFFLPALSGEDLKKAAVILKETCTGLCVVLSGEDGAYYFAMSSMTVDVKEYVREATKALSGSGGGRYEVVQGRFQATREEIERYFSGK